MTSCDPVERTFSLADADATVALGALLGARLQPGQALALSGDLGAGKTCLTRGVARGLGVEDPDAVASPTYLLAVEHPGPVPMLHVDAYLPEKTRNFLLDGGVDYLDELSGVAVVEWAERVADLLPTETLRVELRPDPSGRTGRIATVVGPAAFAWVVDLVEFPDES
ncbi:MAG: tRNA (adenosine(37)-N6)-threonylcarbamoyltransferase complex ATPase subunit type 1 TsaE [Planctomycetota bacterium]